MSEFEIFTVVLSFILGLGIAQILSSVVLLIHARREIELSLTPFLWAAVLFLLHINFLFAALWFYSGDRAFVWYLLDLVSATLLFIGGGLVLPSESRVLPDSLDEFFDRDGRLALIPLAVFLLASLPYNVQAGGSWLRLDNLIISTVCVLCVSAFLARGRTRVAASVASALIVTYAFLFVFARPGAV